MTKKTKEEKRAYNQEYYQRNKALVLDKAKEYYESNKDKRSPEDIEKHKARQKIYYARTKDNSARKAVRRACSKSWYESNKDKILQERKEWRKQMLGTFEYRFKRVIQTARQRGIIFSLTLDQFIEAADKQCYYCGGAFCDPVLEGSGLDRIDSNKGYELGNIVSCGFRCNQIKMDDLTMEEAKVAIAAILQFRLREIAKYEKGTNG